MFRHRRPSTRYLLVSIDNTLRTLVTKTQELQDHLDELAIAVGAATSSLRDALATLLAKVNDLPGGIDIDTSDIDAAVAALAALGTDPDADGTPGLPADEEPEPEPAPDGDTGLSQG